LFGAESWKGLGTPGGQAFACVLLQCSPCSELFGRTAAGFDTGARRSKKRSGRADYGENSGWVFWGVGAAILLRVQWEGDGEKESEAKEYKGRFFH
jgi:hypothetical protein